MKSEKKTNYLKKQKSEKWKNLGEDKSYGEKNEKINAFVDVAIVYINKLDEILTGTVFLNIGTTVGC